jgi:hypothetical protein
MESVYCDICFVIIDNEHNKLVHMKFRHPKEFEKKTNFEKKDEETPTFDMDHDSEENPSKLNAFSLSTNDLLPTSYSPLVIIF